ncbi:MAG: Holliday junction branch migration protein RuvA [Candidatus Krumholzibacteriota bacterium]|nr:Holliday junction branch migration protein RuvA [Candidatus Krumholzibacteriota bacterium]
MIESLTGRILAAAPDLLLQVGPVVLRLGISEQTRAALPEPGAEATVLAELLVREDALELLGFARAEERALFRLLTGVSGVGKRLALAILSELSVEDLALAVNRRDERRLVRVSGVGRKTASRLLLELESRLEEFLPREAAAAPAAAADPRAEEVLAALMALGLNQAAALRALTSVDTGDADLGVEELIRRALAARA